MTTEKEFFYPNIAGYLGNSTASAEELQKKIDEFSTTFKVIGISMELLSPILETNLPRGFAFFLTYIASFDF